ncbi:MAG: hypothetical protein BGO68_00220 [Candidatus Amoebophilus sp. 36-38]|nr:MAG: hypothetical protein BGO68_00220 [Candidatus Amoebophilus sp. 36-38]
MQLSFQDYLIILGPSLGLMSLMWHHFNTRFDKIDVRFQGLDEKLTKKIEHVEEKLTKKIEHVEEKLTKKIEHLERNWDEKINMADTKLSEKLDTVRDRVSRIEGQLIPTKIVSFEVPFEETSPKKKLKEQQGQKPSLPSQNRVLA